MTRMKTQDVDSAATPQVSPAISTFSTSTTQVHKIARKNMNPYDEVPPADPRAVKSVKELCLKIKTLYPSYATGFEEGYAAWKETWFTGANQFASTPDLTSSPEFEALANLGARSLPLVVEKLTGPQDFFATSLYNEIETKSEFKVDRNNVLDYCTLQRHANLLIDINYDRYCNFEEALKDFKTSMHQKTTTSAST